LRGGGRPRNPREEAPPRDPREAEQSRPPPCRGGAHQGGDHEAVPAGVQDGIDPGWAPARLERRRGSGVARSRSSTPRCRRSQADASPSSAPPSWGRRPGSRCSPRPARPRRRPPSGAARAGSPSRAEGRPSRPTRSTGRLRPRRPGPRSTSTRCRRTSRRQGSAAPRRDRQTPSWSMGFASVVVTKARASCKESSSVVLTAYTSA
jgi:hypothetical protein